MFNMTVKQLARGKALRFKALICAQGTSSLPNASQ
jgi:hypothetical protein